MKNSSPMFPRLQVCTFVVLIVALQKMVSLAEKALPVILHRCVHMHTVLGVYRMDLILRTATCKEVVLSFNAFCCDLPEQFRLLHSIKSFAGVHKIGV